VEGMDEAPDNENNHAEINELTEGIDIRNRMLDLIVNKHEGELSSLKSCDRNLLNREVKLLNVVLKTIKSNNVTEDNQLLHAAAYLVCERMGKLKKHQGVINRRSPFGKEESKTVFYNGERI